MHTTQQEAIFLLSHIKKTDYVLEYGSGSSTLEISKLCQNLVSIEHQYIWFNKLRFRINENTILKYCPPDKPYIEGLHCGTYDEFKTYIETPLQFNKFDIIYIDGRARNYCAAICNKLGHQDTLVFVHDFDREEYKEMHNYLDVIEGVERMYKFKIKF